MPLDRLRTRIEARAAAQREKLITDPNEARISAGALVVWAFLLAWPARDIATGDIRPAGLAAPALAAFLAAYVAVARLSVVESPRLGRRVWLLAVLAGLAVGGTLGFGHTWSLTFLFLAMACAVALPEPIVSMGGVLATVGVQSVCLLVGPDSLPDVGSQAWSAFLSGFIVWLIRRSFVGITTLREVREELATLAVAQERVRFARDLHDLLGHTLSLIVIKSEVVRRLATVDPEAAAREAADIETVGRQALAEVREAVSGYRERSLGDELSDARRALSAAGIETTVRMAGPPLPAEADQLLAWVVREGVTNVIRHSHARRCTIAVRRGSGPAGDRAEVEVGDDGVGGVVEGGVGEGGAAAAPGNGLAGLSERLDAAGGSLRAEPGRRGYRLIASVPAERTVPGVIRILLAEDQGMLRGALALLLDLEADLQVVAEVGSGAEVVPTAVRVRPDVALLDIEMPELSGLAAAAALRDELPDCKVLILTTFGRPGYLRRAMEAGASGFLVKDGPADELGAAIRRVLAGEQVIDPGLAAAALRSGHNPLTAREREVLVAGLDGSTVGDIAHRLHLSQATVRNYLSAAIGKTGARNRIEAGRTARDNGWL